MTHPAADSLSLTLTYDSQLIEDYIQTEEVLVDSDAAQPLAVFLNREGLMEASVISKDAQGRDGLYHVQREPLSDSRWNVYGIGAQPIAIAGVSLGVAWAAGIDQQPWCVRAGIWTQLPSLPDGAKLPPVTSSSVNTSVAAAPNGSAWAIDGNGQLYRFVAANGVHTGVWQLVPGLPLLRAIAQPQGVADP
jgi:hypothetical protein